MKGIILAGGTGSRLRPLTLATNKHLLPVYDKPVIYYGVEKLVSAGVYKIMVISSGDHIADFVKLLGSGQQFSRPDGGQVQIVYGVQNEPNGIALALYIARDYVGQEDCALLLGDNIFEDDVAEHIRSFTGGAKVFLKEVHDPHRFGIASVTKEGGVLEIVEKPVQPQSNLAVTGLYLYDATVFEKIVDMPKSERGEYEITYVNNKYIEEGRLSSALLTKQWFDVGTFESLFNASEHMRRAAKKDAHA